MKEQCTCVVCSVCKGEGLVYELIPGEMGDQLLCSECAGQGVIRTCDLCRSKTGKVFSLDYSVEACGTCKGSGSRPAETDDEFMRAACDMCGGSGLADTFTTTVAASRSWKDCGQGSHNPGPGCADCREAAHQGNDVREDKLNGST